MGLRGEDGGTTLPPASLGVTAQYQWKSSLAYAIINYSISLVIYALRDLFIRFFGKEVEALRAFFIEGGRANAENQNHPIVRKIEP